LLSDLPRRRRGSPGEVLDDLARVGIALLNGVTAPVDLLTLADAIGTVVPHRDSRPDGVTVIEDRGETGTALAGFSCRGLSPHTDRSSVERPPGLVLAVCSREPAAGGEFVLVDGQMVYDELAATDLAALDALCAPRSALFGGADGHLGSVFSSLCGVVAIRLRLDGLVRFAPTVTPHLPALRGAIDQHTSMLPLRAGTGYVINNQRWLHGRCPFQGPRVLYRVTADPHPGSIPSGFRPTCRQHLSTP
jgi:hypothetical protein